MWFDSWTVTPEPENLDLRDSIRGNLIGDLVGAVPESFFKIDNVDVWVKDFIGSAEFTTASGELMTGLNKTRFKKAQLEGRRQPGSETVLGAISEELQGDERILLGEVSMGGVKYDKLADEQGSSIVYIPRSNTGLEMPSLKIAMYAWTTDENGYQTGIMNTSVFKETKEANGVEAKEEYYYGLEGERRREKRTITIPNNWIDFGDNEMNQCQRTSFSYSVSGTGDGGRVLEVVNQKCYGGYKGLVSYFEIVGETDEAMQVMAHHNVDSHAEGVIDKLAFIIGNKLTGKMCDDVTETVKKEDRSLAVRDGLPEKLNELENQILEPDRRAEAEETGRWQLVPEEENQNLMNLLRMLKGKVEKKLGSRNHLRVRTDFKPGMELPVIDEKMKKETGIEFDYYSEGGAISVIIYRVTSENGGRGASYQMGVVSEKPEETRLRIKSEQFTEVVKIVSKLFSKPSEIVVEYPLDKTELVPFPGELNLVTKRIVEVETFLEAEGISDLGGLTGLDEDDAGWVMSNFSTVENPDLTKPTREQYQQYMEWKNQPVMGEIKMDLPALKAEG